MAARFPVEPPHDALELVEAAFAEHAHERFRVREQLLSASAHVGDIRCAFRDDVASRYTVYVVKA